MPPQIGTKLIEDRPELAALLRLGEAGDTVGEQTWISVIHKMDEVFSDLVRYEVALEEKNAELEEQQRFMRSVLGSMSDLLIVCRRDGRIEDVNDSLLRLTGKSGEALRGTLLAALFADEAQGRQARELIARRDALHDQSFALRDAHGEAALVSLNFNPRHGAGGRTLGSVITGRPVGELRRAYDALQAAHVQLQRTQQQLLQAEKMASLGRLVAGVAHELNNPISFVLGNMHALKRYVQRMQRYLDAIHQGADEQLRAQLREELRIDRIVADLDSLIAGTVEGAERTRDIVDGLKRFSAPASGIAERFDVGEVLARAVDWVRKASPADFGIHVELPAGLCVLGAASQMQQVFMNLVHNAQQATAGRAAPRLDIAGSVDAGELCLRFVDNGPGIAAEALSRLFDPFFTTKPVGQGTGLGLSISYGIVEHHGGRLQARNGDDGGAEFLLWLPLASAQPDGA